METFANASEVTELTMDLPVYMLMRMPHPQPAVLEELMGFLDHRMSLTEDPDAHWDLRMGNALAVLTAAGHPEALGLCAELYNWVDDASPFLQHKILRLVETAVPAAAAPTARKWIKGMHPENEFRLALVILCLRAGLVDEGLKEIVMDLWRRDPLTGARLMGISRHEAFLEHVERELTWLAPFMRYLAPADEFRARGFEQDLWAELAEAWFAIAHPRRLAPLWLDPTLLTEADDPTRVDPSAFHMRLREWQEHLDAYLMERYGADLPGTDEEWLRKLGDGPEEQRWRQRYLEARQTVLDQSTPRRRGLRLVKNPET